MTDVVVEDVVVMPLPFLRTMDTDMGHDDDAGDEGEGGEEHADGNILVDEMDVDTAAADIPVVVVDAAAAAVLLLPAAAVVVVAAVSSE